VGQGQGQGQAPVECQGVLIRRCLRTWVVVRVAVPVVLAVVVLHLVDRVVVEAVDLVLKKLIKLLFIHFGRVS
jgi:hypothetical protein